MYRSLIYVSRSLIEPPDRTREIENIVACSLDRNARLQVRGALIFTERHFAQILEGPEAAVEELMVSIARDPRHETVMVIERKPIDGYRFPDWKLAYWGAATYMDRQVARIIEKQEALTTQVDASGLYTLIHRLAQESHKLQAPIGLRSRT